ncbi:ADP-ribosylation/Crystallin J1 [Mycena olivaceomarginata]|nr:ADP-ribosylation/Crystallin J1 [Mycena olivaceomarginata]
MSLTPLHLQPLAVAAPHTKIRLALLAKALCDALGGPAEFHPRFSTPFLSHMAPNDNFGLPAGVWTDDTSMALALARSIATFDAGGEGDAKGKTEEQEGGDKGKQGKGGMDAADQLDAYYRWWRAGELSATGNCFDIGNTIQSALWLYEDALRAAALPRIARDLGASVFGGNGSLMRVLPVGLAYWRKEEGKVGDLARESSGTTHPNAVCQEACAAWATCVARVVRTAAVAERMQEGLGMTKLDVLHHFASYPYTTPALQEALAADVPLPATLARDPAAMEAHYVAHHRLLRLAVATLRASTAAATAENPNADADDLVEARTLAVLPQAAALPSSGYVVHTLAAALYAFLATSTFEAGALLTANMGDDADTVAAVYGGLAGAWYAVEEVSGKQAEGDEALFWSPRVREWRDALVKRDVVEAVGDELVAFAERT